MSTTATKFKPITRDPAVVRLALATITVCVPKDWKPSQVKEYAHSKAEAVAWEIRKNKKLLKGDPVRQPCSDHKDMVHITLDC